MARLQLIIIFFCVAFATGVAKNNVNLGLWDYKWMNAAKKSIQKGDKTHLNALEDLTKRADAALKEGPFSVTFKNLTPPSGSKNDYMSMGPYWWPDPAKPDGLPYIRRDGEVNPERDKLDSPQLSKLINNVSYLALAWFFTENSAYFDKAIDLLRVWFIDPQTKMNPHLKYGQSIPGINDGRFIGIIDGKSFVVLVDAIALLESSGKMQADDINEIKKWFEDYFIWLTESDFGKQEEDYHNNHSVAFDLQSCGIAYFLGKKDFVKKKISEMRQRRIDPMIEGDGSQPEELIRTRAFGYSVGNLENFIDCGILGKKVGVNIFNYANPKGGSIQKALDFLMQYIGNEEKWEHEQITSWEQVERNLGYLVRKATFVYKDKKYKQIWDDNFAGIQAKQWNSLTIPVRK